MTAYEIISRKRDGIELTGDEIRFFINSYVQGSLPDYQMSALLMAIYFQGMTSAESHALTESYLHSGQVLNLDDILGIKVDKHSTGGVGDKISIMLAPIVAAAGIKVPMISGRGLGHTGGTLDKLESIPGFRIDYNIKEFKEKIDQVGACLIGQTDELAPADKKIYALRDVTATVPSIPLIAASIMSKKVAEGIDALVLDVKTGRGAFMQKKEKAIELAKALIQIGEDHEKPTVAYITDMNEPLGHAIGNWLEIKECIEGLKGNLNDRMMELTHRLCGAMIHLGGKAESADAGYVKSREMITNGAAWKKFLEIVENQEGDISYLEYPEKYPQAKYEETCYASTDGYIESIDSLEVGLCSVALGAGRQKTSDKIDPASGILLHIEKSQQVKNGDPVFTLYTEKKETISEISHRLQNAILYSNDEVSPTPVILDYIDKTHLDY